MHFFRENIEVLLRKYRKLRQHILQIIICITFLCSFLSYEFPMYLFQIEKNLSVLMQG